MADNSFSQKSRDSLSEALGLTTKEITQLHLRYLNPLSTVIIRFIGTHRKFVRAEGIYLTDENGDRYMDFLCGYGALNLGHEPPEVLDALRNVEGCPNILQASLNPFAAKLAEFLAKVTPGKLARCFFCNSGAEAVEAAIKLARCAAGKKILVSAENGFHGKTLGALSVSGKEKYKKPFEPLVPGIRVIPYDDLGALERILRQGNVAAFIVEPIQGEAGVVVPREGYLKGAEKLCRQYGALLIIDEVQTGMGRTGKLFCCEYEKIKPDILCLSKSLGGGVMPIGAMMTTDKIWRKAYGTLETCLLHTSTFGGNSRACACGIAALHTLIEKGWIENARVQGKYLLEQLKSLQKRFSVLEEVRGKGLMIGMRFVRLRGKNPLLEGALTLWVVRHLFRKHRILTAFTLNNFDVLRIAPPLFVTREQLNQFLGALEETLKSAQRFKRFGLIRS